MTGAPAPQRLDEETVATQTVYAGPFLSLRKDTVRDPGGHLRSREYIVHPGAVMILPLFDDGRVVIERQFRYPLRRAVLEYPAGKREGREAPIVCARRELLEETGYLSDRLSYMGSIHNAMGYSSERIDLFLAEALRHEGARLDEGEYLELLTPHWTEVLGWVRDGRITDVKTIIGTHWLEKLLLGGWQLPEPQLLQSYEQLDAAANAG